MSASAQMWRVIEKQRTRREQNYRRDKSSTRADDETFFSFRRPSSSHFVTPKPLLARPSSVQARNKTSSRKWNIKRTTQLFRSIVLLSLSLSLFPHSHIRYQFLTKLCKIWESLQNETQASAIDSTKLLLIQQNVWALRGFFIGWETTVGEGTSRSKAHSVQSHNQRSVCESYSNLNSQRGAIDNLEWNCIVLVKV